MNRNDKNMLKKLSRQDLLEMLIESERYVKHLERELAKTRKQLADRRIMIENSGSIAEAALKLNGIFEAAQAAADQYLENLGVPAESSVEPESSEDTESSAEPEQPEAVEPQHTEANKEEQ